jgi:signal peptidase I
MGKILRGASIFALFILIIISFFYFLCSQQFVGGIPIVISILCLWFCSLIAAIDATRQARLYLIVSGVILIERKNDRWFPVFLSFVFSLPGVGYLYLKKWFFFIVWLVLFVLIVLIPIKFISNVLAIILCTGVVIHLLKYKNGYVIKSMHLVFFALLIIELGFASMLPLIYHVTMECIVFTGESMEPTLEPDDLIVVNYFAYRNREPQVGDIVVLDTKKIPEYVKPYHDSGKPLGTILCKRIRAVEGDKIVTIGQYRVYVNGKKANFIPDDIQDYIKETELTPLDHSFEMPSGQYFLMGDNFFHSADSRIFGTVSREAIKGKVIKVLWPLNKARVLK